MGLLDNVFKNQTEDLDKAITALKDEISTLKAEIADLKAERTAISKERDATKRIKVLEETISRLEVQKSQIEEANEREKREVTHMVGLERKRQQFEAEQAKAGIEQARKEAVLEVKTENLKVEREAFAKEMKFREDRFNTEVGYLKDLMGQILDRLPTVTVDRQISEGTTTKRTISNT